MNSWPVRVPGTVLSELVDPYLDLETGVLRNLVEARTKSELSDAEADLTAARAAQLVEHPLTSTGDLVELQAIHHHLFQDVYPWAGQLRIVDIRKNFEGAQFFLHYEDIERASMFTFSGLAKEQSLRGLSRDVFIERLAYHYDMVNFIHPFREGNGRAQRLFWNQIAARAGWQLDWRSITGEVNDVASRAASDDLDLSPLREMFSRIVSPVAATSQRDDARRAAELARLGLSRDTGMPDLRYPHQPGRGLGD